MDILYIFFLVITSLAVQECHYLTLQEYKKVLELHNATYMIEFFRDDCKYEQLTTPVSTQQVLNYEPDTLEVDLYGIYSTKNDTVVAVSLNKTQLSNVLEFINEFDKGNYSVEPVNNTMVFKGDYPLQLKIALFHHS